MHEPAPPGTALVEMIGGHSQGALRERNSSGHERGSVHGRAGGAKGDVETDDRGTLFSTRSETIPLRLQAQTYLRRLQEGEFETGQQHKRSGSKVRGLAATNRDLDDMVSKRSRFAVTLVPDHVFSYPVPPLRDRLKDIPTLLWRTSWINLSEQMGSRSHDVPAK